MPQAFAGAKIETFNTYYKNAFPIGNRFFPNGYAQIDLKRE
jgi:hypothetical protein